MVAAASAAPGCTRTLICLVDMRGSRRLDGKAREGATLDAFTASPSVVHALARAEGGAVGAGSQVCLPRVPLWPAISGRPMRLAGAYGGMQSCLRNGRWRDPMHPNWLSAPSQQSRRTVLAGIAALG